MPDFCRFQGSKFLDITLVVFMEGIVASLPFGSNKGLNALNYSADTSPSILNVCWSVDIVRVCGRQQLPLF